MTIVRDTITLLGFLCVTVGLYLAWPPLAWIVGGAAMLAGGVGWQAWEWRETRKRERNTRQ